MTDFDVSVIVPTFNRVHFIQECLDSLLEQTQPAREILVIDDGSEDDTAARVATYGNRVRYVRKENGGKPSAVNQGLALTSGNLIWIFDDDDVALPDAIEHRVAVLRLNPYAGFVYSPHFLGTDGCDGRIVRGCLHNTPGYNQDIFFGELLKTCFFHLATALVRRELYDQVGGFDEALLSSEDYDMQIRLSRISKAVFCPTPTFIFRQHTGVRGAKAIRYSGTERGRVFRRFDQKVGQKIRVDLTLAEYWIPRRQTIESEADRRYALLTRMVVMASKGCVPEMLDDLTAALQSLKPPQSLNAAEVKMIRNAICTGYAYEACQDQWSVFKSQVQQIRQYPSGYQAGFALAIGFLKFAKSYPGSAGVRLKRIYAALLLVCYLFS